MNQITINTSNPKQIIDITEEINSTLEIENGICNIHIIHSTAAITTADLDPGTDLDMLDAFEKMVPKLNYRHPHNPAHVGDHIMASLIGPSVNIPIENGKLLLGTWQSVVLIEFNGPRNRTVIITTTNEG